VNENPNPSSAEAPVCSAKGCRRPAGWALLWRNPRIHGPERVKQWSACDEHRETLADFLARRDFPLTVEKLG
jgi:hypothetical protein